MSTEPQITPAWLQSIGFSLGTLSATKLIEPECEGSAITEVCLEPVSLPPHPGLPDAGSWHVSLNQGMPDDPHSLDDHVLLTHKTYSHRSELVPLLVELGAMRESETHD